MFKRVNPRALRLRRHRRVRKKVFGHPTRPRLAVYRSLAHIYAQVIDDVAGATIVQASTLDPEVRPLLAGKTKTDEARVVGQMIAERAKAKGLTRV
ncbi:MAG: 50S ribosomal protein L18, partial [Dehalococcoidia bacterium]|nr:50S ribosomal protein L18 [Dehalococcoidia bacterium]